MIVNVYTERKRACDNRKYVKAVAPVLPSKQINSTDRLLNAIFTFDESIGMPQGALNAYMSDKTSPEVKNFIKQQLLAERSVQMDNSAFESLTDDVRLSLERRPMENRTDYAKRIHGWLQTELNREAFEREQKVE